MLKKWFTLPTLDETESSDRPVRNGSVEPTQVVVVSPGEPPPASRGQGAVPTVPVSGVPVGKYSPFEQVYQSAAIKPPRIPYNILKVAEMASSSHLATMSPDAKRCSLLMALEAAGAEVEDVLQDAVVRQRALHEYEEMQKNRVKAFEQAKDEENAKIQAELERLTKLHMSRIQANLDEVAREQDTLRAWQKSKQQELQRITEAAAFCVPQGSAMGVNSLAAVLERATTAHG